MSVDWRDLGCQMLCGESSFYTNWQLVAGGIGVMNSWEVCTYSSHKLVHCRYSGTTVELFVQVRYTH